MAYLPRFQMIEVEFDTRSLFPPMGRLAMSICDKNLDRLMSAMNTPSHAAAHGSRGCFNSTRLIRNFVPYYLLSQIFRLNLVSNDRQPLCVKMEEAV